jgi:hypothetical protein
MEGTDYGSKVTRIAWQLLFFRRLLHSRVPATSAVLGDLTQVMYALRGHRSPVDEAEETIRRWPFEIPD